MVVNLFFKVDVEHTAEKGNGRSICGCVSLINRLTTMWTWPFSVKPSLCFPLICCVYPSVFFSEVVMCSLTQHAHLPQTVWFSRTNECRMLLLLLCVCDAVPSLPEPASHHQAGAGWGLLSWSPLAFCYQLEQLCDELQSGGFLRGEPEQSSAGERCAWPGLLMLDNKQTQQFSWVSHAHRDRRDVNHKGRTLNLLVIKTNVSPCSVFCVYV